MALSVHWPVMLIGEDLEYEAPSVGLVMERTGASLSLQAESPRSAIKAKI